MITHTSESQAIYVQDLCLWHDETPIFHKLTWSLAPQQWTCLLGQSGIGKSSLLRLLAGLLSEKASVQGKISRQKQIAYLGQNDALLPWLTVFDNASLGARIGVYSKAEKKIIRQRALQLLRKVGLEDAAHLYPRQLSGGMRQRAALVRALAEDKPVVLMDEPFSRLDAITRHQLQNLAAALLKDKTVLLVTHDPHEALRLADRIDVLHGRPAVIETIAAFSTRGPRELASAELLNLQKQLVQALSDNYFSSKKLFKVCDNLECKTGS